MQVTLYRSISISNIDQGIILCSMKERSIKEIFFNEMHG